MEEVQQYVNEIQKFKWSNTFGMDYETELQPFIQFLFKKNNILIEEIHVNHFVPEDIEYFYETYQRIEGDTKLLNGCIVVYDCFIYKLQNELKKIYEIDDKNNIDMTVNAINSSINLLNQYKKHIQNYKQQWWKNNDKKMKYKENMSILF